jgi:hypothetical protein
MRLDWSRLESKLNKALRQAFVEFGEKAGSARRFEFVPCSRCMLDECKTAWPGRGAGCLPVKADLSRNTVGCMQPTPIGRFVLRSEVFDET